jgi:hypothetical protein
MNPNITDRERIWQNMRVRASFQSTRKQRISRPYFLLLLWMDKNGAQMLSSAVFGVGRASDMKYGTLV